VDSNGEAYLDIETTGLSPQCCDITVIGIHLFKPPDREEFVQLVGDDITPKNLLAALEGIGRLFTFNGARFDLPWIRHHLGLDLSAGGIEHCDLMHHCQRRQLFGGLKKIEPLLGIPRSLPEMNGYQAVKLWWRYINDFDHQALATLLAYNKEDTRNLVQLRRLVMNDFAPPPDVV
jgi:uncharacterized protein YprB with RNaseH-like and TPR domain